MDGKFRRVVGGYRYGFNGMERDDNVKGKGNSYTTEFRQYDPRVGRWLSLDPLMGMFPSISPYVAYANNPIYYTDPYGLAPGNDDEGGDDDVKIGDKKTEIDDKGNVVDYTYTYIKNKAEGYIKGWKGRINEKKTNRMNAHEVNIVGIRDYRTSGDLTSSDGGMAPPKERYQGVNTKDALVLTANILAEFKGIPLAGEIISFASLDPKDPNPIALLPLPDLSSKWDNEMDEFGKRGASKSWDVMVEYARKYNTNENTSVIFVYAAQDVHESLNRQVPTAAAYKTAEEAEAALGFKPRVVYYKFIDNKTKSLEISVQKKLKIK